MQHLDTLFSTLESTIARSVLGASPYESTIEIDSVTRLSGKFVVMYHLLSTRYIEGEVQRTTRVGCFDPATQRLEWDCVVNIEPD